MKESGEMPDTNRIYVAIDLKSFYASVECAERGLDAMTTNLVVADPTRTEKTICLAVSPSLKAYGISGRARLFEAIARVKEVNRQRKYKLYRNDFEGKSYNDTELKANPKLELDFIIAPPQMAKYMEISTKIYNVYLKYIAPEDIHVYSIDEVFIDVTGYLQTYKMTANQIAMMMIKDVLSETGITATAGIGTNLYLAKVAMDIVAKHIPADENGVRIAELDEMSYREKLWSHRPLTDFWRVGRGYSKKLEAYNIYTMGDIARCSLGQKHQYHSEDLLYKLFGVNAELLIDHAWGWEPCTIAEIKAYRPQTNSLSMGQVLKEPYSFEKGRLIVREMADLLVLDIVDKGLVTDQMVLTVGYDIENLKTPELENSFEGKISTDAYGRKVPKSAHGSINLGRKTSSTKIITEKITELYENIVDRKLTIRRMYVVANNVTPLSQLKEDAPVQLDLFTDYEEDKKKKQAENAELERERELQKAMLKIKKKYGKNAVLKGMNFTDGATTIERNGQVGGHKA